MIHFQYFLVTEDEAKNITGRWPLVTRAVFLRPFEVLTYFQPSEEATSTQPSKSLKRKMHLSKVIAEAAFKQVILFHLYFRSDNQNVSLDLTRIDPADLQGLLVQCSNWFGISSVQFSSLGASVSGKFV